MYINATKNLELIIASSTDIGKIKKYHVNISLVADFGKNGAPDIAHRAKRNILRLSN